jgi:hypothetical protein
MASRADAARGGSGAAGSLVAANDAAPPPGFFTRNLFHTRASPSSFLRARVPVRQRRRASPPGRGRAGQPKEGARRQGRADGPEACSWPRGLLKAQDRSWSMSWSGRGTVALWARGRAGVGKRSGANRRFPGQTPEPLADHRGGCHVPGRTSAMSRRACNLRAQFWTLRPELPTVAQDRQNGRANRCKEERS